MLAFHMNSNRPLHLQLKLQGANTSGIFPYSLQAFAILLSNKLHLLFQLFKASPLHLKVPFLHQLLLVISLYRQLWQ